VLSLNQALVASSLAKCHQVGQALGREPTITREPEAVVVSLSSFCRQEESLTMLARTNLSRKPYDQSQRLKSFMKPLGPLQSRSSISYPGVR
jgi:hypothetical protein